ncbi:MAG: hypothetical protein EPN85_09865 [Bacteroidetes bacterium]|nr:MAG: hypothetical protein EPN85_09865 [Bacteroidota bacterium]
MAKELGMTVSQLLDNTNSHELTEWGVFFRMISKEQATEKKEENVSEQIKKSFMAYGRGPGK